MCQNLNCDMKCELSYFGLLLPGKLRQIVSKQILIALSLT